MLARMASKRLPVRNLIPRLTTFYLTIDDPFIVVAMGVCQHLTTRMRILRNDGTRKIQTT